MWGDLGHVSPRLCKGEAPKPNQEHLKTLLRNHGQFIIWLNVTQA